MSQKEEEEEEEEVVSNPWSHGLHSEISVLHSRMQSCGNRRQRLPGSTADERPVTVMFHMWRWTSSSAAAAGQQKPHLTQRDMATANRSNYGGADNRNDSFYLAFTLVGEGALCWQAVSPD